MIRPLIVLTAAALALPALAQTGTTPPTTTPTAAQAAPGDPPQRIRSVTLVGDQTCPPPVGDEVVVCARIAPGEQYRIPRELRSEGPIEVQRQSWAAKTDRMDEIAREAGGLPNTCSPAGTGGQSGCTQVMLERARADRRQGNANPPR